MEENTVAGTAFCREVDGHIMSTVRKQGGLLITVYPASKPRKMNTGTQLPFFSLKN